jgi:transcriptional regulator with XRE-family HTH domain
MAWWEDPPLAIKQLKAARGALGWGLRKTAQAGGTSPQTLCKFENGGTVHPSVLEPVKVALEAEGVIFLESTKKRRAGRPEDPASHSTGGNRRPPAGPHYDQEMIGEPGRSRGRAAGPGGAVQAASGTP